MTRLDEGRAAWTEGLEIPADDRTYATLIHVGALAAGILTGGTLVWLPPLVMWLLKRNASPFLDDHGREALNFSISLVIYGFVIGLLALPTLGVAVLLYVPLVIVALVGFIRAAVSANRGDYFRYPMCIRLIASPGR